MMLPLLYPSNALLPATRAGVARAGRICRLGRASRYCLLLVVMSLAVAPAAASDASNDRPQDEIWLVSSRHIGCISSEESPDLRAQQYSADHGWQHAAVDDLFHPSSPDQILVVFIHGNRVSSQEVASEGRYVYRLTTSHIDDANSIRFVIWSWPSAQVRGQLRDVRAKANRTELDGYCLGWFLQQVPKEQRVSLFGYSFGARIATGAMHLIGSGHLSRRVLPPHDGEPGQVRIVMIAAALHNYWLRPGGYHELAVSHLDYMLNLYNCCDPVLKHYHLLYKHSHAEALGHSGMYTRDLGETADLIEQRDTCNSVQRSHAAIHYFENRTLRRRMQTVLFWRPVGA